MSHPTWVCGLKPSDYSGYAKIEIVTPYVGVWIETSVIFRRDISCGVTPYVGVWIETPVHSWRQISSWSHPTWVCGLKLKFAVQTIESSDSHTLRGCVD